MTNDDVVEFLVWCPGYGEAERGAAKIPAIYPDEAVEEWARQVDLERADRPILSGTPAEVYVRHPRTEKVLKYAVFGDNEPTYDASFLGRVNDD